MTKTYRDGMYELEETGDFLGIKEVLIRSKNQTETVRLQTTKKGGFDIYIRLDKETPWSKIGYRNRKDRAIRLGKESLYKEFIRNR